MLLVPGTRLGPFEIVAPLGAGGMGEVYKAHDTRLDRTVAIKILPAAVADDPQRRERFRREARAISSLTHPHICTLHDIGEHDGAEFLVMEYLQGETLAHRLLRGAMPLDDVLRIAGQIAEALDAAHRAGLIHRDLKPGNVMLTKGGVKVLDFGLAKWQGTDADLTSASSAALSTAPSTLTQVGTAVGTTHYMAPEQVEGKPVDARTDLFALGAIVYEMTTGRKAFEGTSSASVMAAILSATPAPMTSLQPVTPAALDHVVKTCLAKNPEERWQGAGDVARELKWIAQLMSQTREPARGIARTQRSFYYWLGAAAALLGLTSAPLAFVHLREAPLESRSVRLFVPPPDHAAYPNYNEIESPPVISPDGRQIAFVAHEIGGPDSVWVRALDSLSARALPGTDGVPASSLRPFWSPDSRSIGFFAGGKLKRIDLTGGPPQVLADAPDARGGAWNQQGVIVFSPTADGPLYRVSAAGGAVTAATRLRPPEIGHRWPVFLPDGRHFLYLSRKFPQLRDSTTDVASLDSAEAVRALDVGETLVNVAFADTGHLLFVRGGTLFAQPFDGKRFVLTGERITIAEHVGWDTGPGATFSISTNGTLVYRQQRAPISAQLVWFDRAGQRVGAIGIPASQDGVSLSPDGTRVVVRKLLGGRYDIWVLSVATGAASRLTFDSGNLAPVWSPDGHQIAFGTQRHEGDHVVNGVFGKSSSGVGSVEALVRGRYATNPTDWSHDARFMVYADQDSVTKNDLWALPLSGNRTPIPLVRTTGFDRFGQLSPDDRWLAYTSDVSGSEEVYVQAFPTARGQWQVSTSGGTQPRWRRDGKELFYVSARGELVAATVSAGAEGIGVSAQKPLFAYHGGGEDYTYDVSPDGQRFLVNTVVSDTSQPIVLVLNWPAGLKK
jgi:serine/threonine protein kinase